MYRSILFAVALALPLAACGRPSSMNDASPSGAAFNEALYSNLDVVAGETSVPSSPIDRLKARAEGDVREALKDPMSAQFRSEVASVGGNCVMGQVISKNGFGALTGYQGFVWTDGATAIQDANQQRWLKAQGECFAAIGREAKAFVDEQQSAGKRRIH